MPRILFMLMLVTMVGCSKPENHPLPTDLKTASEDKDFQAAVQKLPQDERELLAAYMIRSTLASAFTGGVSKGSAKTLGDAIAEQRKFVADEKAEEDAQKALAAKVAADTAAAVKAMNDVMTVALTGKGVLAKNFDEGRYSDEITLTVAFQNKSAKDVAGVKGLIVLKDIFGDKIESLGVKVDEPIPAGQTYVWHGSKEENQFDNEDVKLADTAFEKMKGVWEPATYMFKDGTSLKAPESE